MKTYKSGLKRMKIYKNGQININITWMTNMTSRKKLGNLDDKKCMPRRIFTGNSRLPKTQ